MNVVASLGKAAFIFAVSRISRRWRWYRSGRIFCPIRHRAGQIIVRHEASFDCSIAERVGEVAEMVWQALGERYFLGQRAERFTLFLVYDRDRGPALRHGRDVVVNLFRVRGGDDLLDSLVEEVFHLRESLAGIPHQYVFHIPDSYGDVDHEDIVRHYAENDFEYRALVAAVELVGYRAELLEEVEQYRIEHGGGA